VAAAPRWIHRNTAIESWNLDRKLVISLPSSLRQPKEAVTTIPLGRLENPTQVQWRRAKKRRYRGGMNTSRFNYDRRSGATTDPSARNYLKWIRVSRISTSLLSDSTGSGRKKIFAIVAPSTRVNSDGKTIRRILIFDNHPESLRLVYRQRSTPDVDLVAARRAHPVHLVFALLLMLALWIAMFWPLIVRCHSL
jgi:hypothetical protein